MGPLLLAENSPAMSCSAWWPFKLWVPSHWCKSSNALFKLLFNLLLSLDGFAAVEELLEDVPDFS